MAEPGQVVDERYELRELLGEGGMGAVWRALDRQRGIEVAIKMLRSDAGSRRTMATLFAQEAELSQRMISRHIVRVLERGVSTDGVPFIVFELLDGEDLGRRLDREGTLPLTECSEMVVQVCRALERAHAVGAVHRDIKPENIFHCESEGLFKVLDFGIASLKKSRFARVAETTKGLSGTIEHMAPENVLDGKEADARGDLYALGVVAYRALSGTLPFPAANLGQLVLAFSRGAAPAPSTLRSDVPAALDAWVLRAIERDPERRFPSAREMAEAFARASGKVSANVSRTMEPVVIEPVFRSPTAYSEISPSSRRRR
jgi:serine/threonine-protein kinase